MLLIRSRKGVAWAGVFAFLVIIAGVVMFSNVSSRECSKDAQCGENKYCGSDFSCHQIPVITIKKTEYQNDFVTPSAIVGVAIVIAALVLKKRQ